MVSMAVLLDELFLGYVSELFFLFLGGNDCVAVYLRKVPGSLTQMAYRPSGGSLPPLIIRNLRNLAEFSVSAP